MFGVEEKDFNKVLHREEELVEVKDHSLSLIDSNYAYLILPQHVHSYPSTPSRALLLHHTTP